MSIKEQYTYINSLPSNIIKAIKDYTYVAYEYINESLRKKIPMSLKHEDIYFGLQEAFENAPPLKEQIQVYRKVYTTKENFRFNEMNSYISTSLSPEEIKDVDSCCILIITLPVGSKALFISEISDFSIENEVLLDKDGMYIKTKEGNEEHSFNSGTVYTYYITHIPKNSVRV